MRVLFVAGLTPVGPAKRLSVYCNSVLTKSLFPSVISWSCIMTRPLEYSSILKLGLGPSLGFVMCQYLTMI